MKKISLPHHHGESDNLNELFVQLSSLEKYQAAAELFKKLGDANRVRIFWLLCNCEECVINMSAILGLSSPAISHHLRSLKDNKFIVSRRDGKEVYYKASDSVESRLLKKMLYTALKDISDIM